MSIFSILTRRHWGRVAVGSRDPQVRGRDCQARAERWNEKRDGERSVGCEVTSVPRMVIQTSAGTSRFSGESIKESPARAELLLGTPETALCHRAHVQSLLQTLRTTELGWTFNTSKAI